MRESASGPPAPEVSRTEMSTTNNHNRRSTTMEFGICFKGFVSPDRARNLVKQAEEAGFDYCWFYDSHILWRECYPAIAMCMEHTTPNALRSLRHQPQCPRLVTGSQPLRQLAKQSGGRFDVGLGRGDSSVRVMGKKPATLARVGRVHPQGEGHGARGGSDLWRVPGTGQVPLGGWLRAAGPYRRLWSQGPPDRRRGRRWRDPADRRSPTWSSGSATRPSRRVRRPVAT